MSSKILRNIGETENHGRRKNNTENVDRRIKKMAEKVKM